MVLVNKINLPFAGLGNCRTPATGSGKGDSDHHELGLGIFVRVIQDACNPNFNPSNPQFGADARVVQAARGRLA